MEPNFFRTQQINQRATNLRGNLRTLEELKHTTQPRPEIHTGTQPAGPREPGNTAAVHLAVDIEQCLMELCCDARNHIDPQRAFRMDGEELTGWIIFNAALIAELDFAADFADNLRELGHRTERFIDPTPRLKRAEPRQYAPAICQQLHARGHHVTPTTLRQWAHRSVATDHPITIIARNGKNTYLATEVIAYAERNRNA